MLSLTPDKWSCWLHASCNTVKQLSLRQVWNLTLHCIIPKSPAIQIPLNQKQRGEAENIPAMADCHFILFLGNMFVWKGTCRDEFFLYSTTQSSKVAASKLSVFTVAKIYLHSLWCEVWVEVQNKGNIFHIYVSPCFKSAPSNATIMSSVNIHYLAYNTQSQPLKNWIYTPCFA